MNEKQLAPSPIGRRGKSGRRSAGDTALTGAKPEFVAVGESQRLELAGERLRAEVTREQPEVVRVYTELVERTEQISVTLHEERLIIETRGGSGHVTLNGSTIGRDDRLEIVLSTERAVVSTEVVPVEEVLIRTERNKHIEEITARVRREELVIEGPRGRIASAPGEVTIVEAPVESLARG